MQCDVVCSASSARLRLLRLSDAAEKLKRQAAINVHTGKENDARELLIQKKKVMEAMEKSKNRIELLDELSTKLTEVSEELFLPKDYICELMITFLTKSQENFDFRKHVCFICTVRIMLD